MLRDQHEKGLSVNWLERLSKRRGEPINALIVLLQRRLVEKRRRINRNDKLLVLHVARTRHHLLKTHTRYLEFLYCPEPTDDSHAEIRGYGHEDSLVADLIAETVQVVYPARETS
jgi:hypothetical protein